MNKKLVKFFIIFHLLLTSVLSGQIMDGGGTDLGGNIQNRSYYLLGYMNFLKFGAKPSFCLEGSIGYIWSIQDTVTTGSILSVGPKIYFPFKSKLLFEFNPNVGTNNFNFKFEKIRWLIEASMDWAPINENIYLNIGINYGNLLIIEQKPSWGIKMGIYMNIDIGTWVIKHGKEILNPR